ncbi:MAG: hypothetical protein LBR34_02105 [Prevotella sp.]|jgi:hypothetical protein|nr:hypothetical protein [Prevotella sp.]
MEQETIKNVVPADVLSDIKSYIHNTITSEQKHAIWERANENEDTLVGDIFGNLCTNEFHKVQNNQQWEWRISYNKLSSCAMESQTGADGIITIKVIRAKNEKPLYKSILFQAKKGDNYNDLKEQKKKMLKESANGSAVFRFKKDDFYAYSVLPENDGKQYKMENYLTDVFIECAHGELGMHYDSSNRKIVRDDVNEESYEKSLSYTSTITIKELTNNSKTKEND